MASLAALPALLQAQDWAAAERLLRRAAQGKAPAEVYYNLAKVLEAGGKPEQRLPWLKKAVATRPDYAIAWFELGRAALDTDLPLASRAFARAAALDPGDADARRNLGRVALRLCDWDTAARAFDGGTDDEAALARYRIATERGEDTQAQRDALLAQRPLRPEVLKALTRTARGSFPLRLP